MSLAGGEIARLGRHGKWELESGIEKTVKFLSENSERGQAWQKGSISSRVKEGLLGL